MRLIDMHCDTLHKCYEKGYGLRKNSGQVDLYSIQSANGLAQFFAIFLPETIDGNGARIEPMELFERVYAIYINEITKNSDFINPALNYLDVYKNNDNNRISSILTIEDGALVNNDISMFQKLYNKGVRLITLLWNNENCLGYPSSLDSTINKKGLKGFGIQAVEEMDKLGIIVDVSHMSEGGFYDVAKYAKKPFVASHSCARALCNHPRNLTDLQLKTIANSGGVVGINFYSEFLRENSSFTTIDDILRHIDYMINKMGSEGVALGSDFDGIDCQLEISGYAQYDRLINSLEKRLTEEVLEKICYKNVLRIIKDCI